MKNLSGYEKIGIGAGVLFLLLCAVHFFTPTFGQRTCGYCQADLDYNQPCI